MKRKKLGATLLALFLAFALLPGMMPLQASAATSSEIRNQIKEMKEENKELKEQLNKLYDQFQENEDEIQGMVDRKNLIDQEISILTEQIRNINTQITAFGLLIADKQDELDEANARLRELSEKHKARIQAMEEEGNLSYWEVLFKANSFADLLDRLNMIQEIAAADRRRLQTLTEAAALVEAARDALQVEKNDLEVTRHSLDAAQTDLENKKLEAQNMINELLDKAKDMEGLLEGFEDDEAALMAEIAKM